MAIPRVIPDSDFRPLPFVRDYRPNYSTSKGDKTPVHSHPETVLYVVKGDKIRTTLPDGTSTVVELKTGQTSLRPPVSHSDEALDDIEALIIELKK